MFSPTIQSLIDSSGREAALKRSMALNTYVNSFEKVSEEFMPKSGNFFSTNSTTNSPSFAQVLTNVASPSSKVQDYTFGLNVLPKSNLNLEDENFFSQKKYETKDDIKQLISQVCEKYKVDSKLIAVRAYSAIIRRRRLRSYYEVKCPYILLHHSRNIYQTEI